MSDNSDLVTIDAFGRTWKNILRGLAEDLRTLESEGCLYSSFAQKDPGGEYDGTVNRVRIRLTPAELVEYVGAQTAQQQFDQGLRESGDFTAAALAVQEEKYRKRLVEYGGHGRSRLKDGGTADIRGCFASFLGADLEGLICGGMTERYEPVVELGSKSSREELVGQILNRLPVSLRKIEVRGNNRPGISMINEYDIQDFTEFALLGTFPDTTREEWTPKRAGSAKRIDLVIASQGVVIECKFVRDRTHAKKVADELRVDFETYHDHPSCARLFVYVHDPGRFIIDPEQFAVDLDGMRKKGEHEYLVKVIVG